MTAVPDWLIPPVGGFTADDLDNMPGLPPHTELLDGSLVFMSPQRYFHSVAIDLLIQGLRIHCPQHLRVVREMSVVLSKRDRPEPDVSVIRAEAVNRGNGDETSYRPSDVLLAVEVVSPDSVERDRELKPRKYARAGVPYFWRVEQSEVGLHPVVYVYELDPEAGEYVAKGEFRGELRAAEPFPVAIDLTEIDRL
ncbi:Uma2 family endonuclease [Kitasatospora sp. NPDC002227]|uniref:Uma2 family endonuclease n=1 Tax=Kitasatospora sp. NPDC002227 TaxID=3154773 RepID=UPI00332F4254